LLAALFGIAAATTMLAIQRWKRNKSAPIPPHQGTLDSIPGVAEGDLVKLPKLPTLGNNYVDLGTVNQEHLVCAFISTECAGCSQDEEFWRNLRKEISQKNVAFYVISLDVDQFKVEKFVRAYGFDDLPVLFDPQREALVAFKIHFVPQYILLTPEGRVVASWKGLRQYDPRQQNAMDKLDGLRDRLSDTSKYIH